MANPTNVTVMTNDRADSCVQVRCDCATIWSLAQQFTYLRLCNRKNDGRHRLIDAYARRARRIAATYARFYLEMEEHGDPRKKGRYYWMGLAAFASKTVACSLESIQLSSGGAALKTVRDGLGKGNFWLFMDIAAWHWYRNFNPSTFDQCLSERDASKYVDEVAAQMAKLPWSKESLFKVNHLRITPEIDEGFRLVRSIETGVTESRPTAQLDHLVSIAIHEQKNILQRLIYDDAEFAWWIKIQRGDDKELSRDGSHLLTRVFAVATSIFSPELSINFTANCDTENNDLKSVAPQETVLENYDSRMKWILKVAELFHKRMVGNTKEMESELTKIAGWIGIPDSVNYSDEKPAR